MMMMWNSQSRKHGSSQSNKTPHLMPIVCCSCSTYPRATDFLSLNWTAHIHSHNNERWTILHDSLYPFCDGNNNIGPYRRHLPSLLTITMSVYYTKRNLAGNDHNILPYTVTALFTHGMVSFFFFFFVCAASKRSITCSIQHY